MIKQITTAILSLISFTISAQDVHYTLVNPRNVEIGLDTFHMVDVLTYSSEGFKLGSGQIYINYDTAAFGPNVRANGGLEIIAPDSSVLNQIIGVDPFLFSFYGDFVINDNTLNRFSYSWQHDFSMACMFDENIDYFSNVLFSVKLKYQTGKTDQDPGICLEGSAVYVDQTYTACGPLNCNTSNCFDFPGTQLVADLYSCSDCRFVYSTLDDGPGTLRNALFCTTPGDTIRFTPNLRNDSIILTSTQLVIDKELQVLARESLGILVKGDAVDRVFDILVNNTVYIQGVQITPGSAIEGKALRNNGVLTLHDVLVRTNGTPQDTSLILNQDMLTVRGTTGVVKN